MTINYRRWTTKQIASLRELAELKLSATAIGEQVGATKNAVIGQCHRSGIQLKYQDLRRSKKTLPIRMWKVVSLIEVQPPPPSPPDLSLAVPLLDLEKHHCRQIVSTNGGLAMFCASPKIKAYSYCAFHAAKNFRIERSTQ